MILVNEMEKEKEISKDYFEKLMIILAPFAPHICEEIWQEKVSPYIRNWLKDEIKRNKFETSITLLNRLTLRESNKAEYLFARGEAFRLRSKGDDYQSAIRDYNLAANFANPPAETYKGLGLIYKSRNEKELAKLNFLKYQVLEPNASDSMLIKSYLEELET